MNQPIPAFYCCYLLRSTIQHTQLYVGSTPSPPRRLKQHNSGVAKGGAKRTDKDRYKPWDMVCLVTGFPSKIAALQFEWAWQRPDVTRHIAATDRITPPKVITRYSRRWKKHVKKVVCPQMAMPVRLANLHLLLRSSSFRHWPLHVRFYSGDVHAAWTKMQKKTIGQLRPGMAAVYEKPDYTSDQSGPKGAAAVDPTYRPMKARLGRSRDLLASQGTHACSICTQAVDITKDLVLTCPTASCSATSHLSCLSVNFLGQSSGAQIVPTVGRCKDCGAQLQWSDLVRDLSLRMRGQSVLDALFKPSRKEKAAMTAKAKERLEEEEERRLSGLVGDADAEDEAVLAGIQSDGDSESEADVQAIPGVEAAPAKEKRGRPRKVVEVADSESDGSEVEILR